MYLGCGEFPLSCFLVWLWRRLQARERDFSLLAKAKNSEGSFSWEEKPYINSQHRKYGVDCFPIWFGHIHAVCGLFRSASLFLSSEWNCHHNGDDVVLVMNMLLSHQLLPISVLFYMLFQTSSSGFQYRRKQKTKTLTRHATSLVQCHES